MGEGAGADPSAAGSRPEETARPGRRRPGLVSVPPGTPSGATLLAGECIAALRAADMKKGPLNDEAAFSVQDTGAGGSWRGRFAQGILHFVDSVVERGEARGRQRSRRGEQVAPPVGLGPTGRVDASGIAPAGGALAIEDESGCEAFGRSLVGGEAAGEVRRAHGALSTRSIGT